MKPSTSSCKTFILICHLLLPTLNASCPSECDNSDNKQGCECKKRCCGEMYWYSRQERQVCECCTARCSESDNQIEVTPCTLGRNRVCHCKAGFFCKHGNNYATYCHSQCVPCATGTFSSVPSLNSFCTPYTDCDSLGKLVSEEGTATQDKVCGDQKSTSTKYTPTTPKIITPHLSTTFTTPNPSMTDSETISPTINTSIHVLSLFHPNMEVTQTHRLHLKTSAGTTFATSANTAQGGNLQLHDSYSMSNVSLLLLILFMMLILGLTVFCMLRKSTVLKTLSKQTGFMSGKHEAFDHISSNSQYNTLTQRNQTVADLPSSSDVSEVRGQSMGVTSDSGGAQQVKMEQNVKGENVNNTIGSIYIYSPGMVILGSNSGDKKDEAGVCEEVDPLISTPQQESTPPLQEVRIKMNTLEDSSLSFPVPVTGK